MTPKSAATKRHLLTQVEFPTGFLNSRATLMQLTLRKTQDFLGETHGSTGARETNQVVSTPTAYLAQCAFSSCGCKPTARKSKNPAALG